MFEPQRQPDKPCGEGILPAGVAALRELGLVDVIAAAVPLERIGYVLASGRELEIPLAPPGCAVERPVLAGALTRALEREANVTRLARRVESERTASGFRLRGGTDCWHASTLVAADGLQGGTAQWLRGIRPRTRRFGLRARAEAHRPLERVEVHLGRTSEVYLTPLPDGRVNVAVLGERAPKGPRSSRDCLDSALREHPRAARALGAWLTPPESRSLARVRPRRVAARGAFLVGDATGGVDPVLGCGVAIALCTGIAAARAAARVLAEGAGRPERSYESFVRRETGLRRRLASSLSFLGAHPRLQDAFARLLAAWPEATAQLARRIGGG